MKICIKSRFIDVISKNSSFANAFFKNTRNDFTNLKAIGINSIRKAVIFKYVDVFSSF